MKAKKREELRENGGQFVYDPTNKRKASKLVDGHIKENEKENVISMHFLLRTEKINETAFIYLQKVYVQKIDTEFDRQAKDVGRGEGAAGEKREPPPLEVIGRRQT